MDGEILRGEVYWLKDRDSVGAEERLRRPVVIVSSDKGNVSCPAVIGASMTTKTRWGVINVPIEATGTRSWVMCNQLWCIDKSRLDGYMGTLTDSEMEEVDRGLTVALGLIGNSSDEEDISALEDEIAQLKSEVSRLEKLLESRESESVVKGDMYKRLYEKALDALVTGKFESDTKVAEEVLPEPEQEKEAPSEEVVAEEVVAEESAPVEINTCTLGELRQIGVDASLANSILKHRPYKDVADLKIVPGMKSIVFAILKNKVCCVQKEKKKPQPKTVDKSPRKLNINTATVDEMFEVAGIPKSTGIYIRSYRNKHGLFKRVEDLLNISRFGTGCLEKYGPKLEV